MYDDMSVCSVRWNILCIESVWCCSSFKDWFFQFLFGSIFSISFRQVFYKCSFIFINFRNLIETNIEFSLRSAIPLNKLTLSFAVYKTPVAKQCLLMRQKIRTFSLSHILVEIRRKLLLKFKYLK